MSRWLEFGGRSSLLLPESLLGSWLFCSLEKQNQSQSHRSVWQERRAGRIWGRCCAVGFGMDDGPALRRLLPVALRPGAFRATREGGSGGPWNCWVGFPTVGAVFQPSAPTSTLQGGFLGHLLWLDLPGAGARPQGTGSLRVPPSAPPTALSEGVSSPPFAFGEGNLLFPSLIPLAPHPVILMEPKTSLLKTSTKPNPPTGSLKSEGSWTRFSC